MADRVCIKCKQAKPDKDFYTRVAQDCRQCSDRKAKESKKPSHRRAWGTYMAKSLHTDEGEN